MRIVIGDRIVRLKDSHYHFDYGVKGMKKGVRHEDPPTGGGGKSLVPAKLSKQKPQTGNLKH